MTILNYSDLRNAVGRWLKRSDLADAAPDFITLYEARANRNLRVRQMETEYSAVITDQTVPLPADWLELLGDPTLDGRPQSFITRDQYKQRTGEVPAYEDGYYTISGSNLKFGANVADGVTLAFDYYAKIPSLSEAAPTNWLITDAPDVYLYGSLLEAEPYLKNDPRIATWQSLLATAMADLQAAGDRAKHSGGTLEIRHA
ncbi:hypothetical protein K6V92_10260 [Cupriavidus respiraculi]|uniref:phage adaptor protein n=1 Tax=Cupriavidus respiraculi TaxID=195930 RepID=UPI001C94E770|nr:hypothetical protein [Cupriavidus respiraculi]MBY4947001.1 hypothetical protein [Cupriavidus respiraculi]